MQVGRLGYDCRTHALDPLVASILTGAWLSAVGRHPFLAPRPPGFGAIVSCCGASLAIVRPHWRRSGALHGCPRCALAAAAGSQVHNLHSRPATCQDIAAALTSHEHPQVALLAVALQLCRGQLELQAFHRLPSIGSSTVAPEVGLLAVCSPLIRAGSPPAADAPPPLLPAPGAFTSSLLHLFVAAGHTHGAAEPEDLFPVLPPPLARRSFFSEPCDVSNTAGGKSLFVCLMVGGEVVAELCRLAATGYPP